MSKMPMKDLSGSAEPCRWLGNTLSKIAAASTRPALWTHVKELAVRFGYSELTAIDALKLAGGLVDAVMDANASMIDILRSIEQEDLAKTHPVLERCLASVEPFKLSELRDDPNETGKRWAELLSDISTRGDVLIVPVYGGEDLKAVFAFGGAHPDFTPLIRLALQAISYAVSARVGAVDTDSDTANNHKLTVRETQCLRWAAMGKTDTEVGQILDISARTVRFHIENAKKKLGVATRTQAVAKAVNEKLIQI